MASVIIPDSVTVIGVDAFCACVGLTSITIPNNVTTIGDLAFNGPSVTSMIIPNKVTSIGNMAFAADKYLASITFNGSAPTLGSGWVNGCSSDLTAYYYQGATGFTTPTWNGIPCYPIDTGELIDRDGERRNHDWF